MATVAQNRAVPPFVMCGGQGCPKPLGFEALHPGGLPENSPAFKRWERDRAAPSPEGTAEKRRARPSLRDLARTVPAPSAESLGYYQMPLPDNPESSSIIYPPRPPKINT